MDMKGQTNMSDRPLNESLCIFCIWLSRSEICAPEWKRELGESPNKLVSKDPHCLYHVLVSSIVSAIL